MAWPTTYKIYVLGSLASFPVATVISGDPPSPRTAGSQCFQQLTFSPFFHSCRYYRGLNPHDLSCVYLSAKPLDYCSSAWRGEVTRDHYRYRKRGQRAQGIVGKTVGLLSHVVRWFGRQLTTVTRKNNKNITFH